MPTKSTLCRKGGFPLAGVVYRPSMRPRPPALPPPLPTRPRAVLYWPAVFAACGAALLLSVGLVVALACVSSPRTVTDELPEFVAASLTPVEPVADRTARAGTNAVPILPHLPLVARDPAEEARRKAPIVRAAVERNRPAPVEVKAPEVVRPPTSLLGTSVEFVDNPAVAARTAAREEKLLYVLHVSGNFEDPQFT